MTKTTTTTTRRPRIFLNTTDHRIIQTKICKGGGASARGCLLSFSPSLGPMIGRRSRKDRSRQRRTRSRSRIARKHIHRDDDDASSFVVGKPLMRRVATSSFKTKNFEKLPFVQSSSRVFETKKKDRRDAPEREPLSVLVLKSDDPQIRSRVLRRRRCYYVYATEMCVQFFITTTTTTIQTYSKKNEREEHVTFDSFFLKRFFFVLFVRIQGKKNGLFRFCAKIFCDPLVLLL